MIVFSPVTIFHAPIYFRALLSRVVEMSAYIIKTILMPLHYATQHLMLIMIIPSTTTTMMMIIIFLQHPGVIRVKITLITLIRRLVVVLICT